MANEFLIRISADDKATATIKKIEAAIAGIMSPLEKAQNKASRLGSVGQAGMEKLHAGLEKVGSATRNLVDGLASIIPGLAAISGAVSVAGLAALADRFASVGFNLSQTSNILGVSRQELQAWQIVGKKAHMTAEEVSSGIMSMNEAIRGADIGTNTGAAGTLAALGVKVQHKDGKIDYAATRKAIVDAVARQEQASGRVAAAASLGVPIKLAENKNVLKDFEAAMNSPLQQTDEAADRARAMQERIDALKMSIESVALTIGDKLVPVLQPAVEAIGKWFDKNKEEIANSIAAAVEKFSQWLQQIDWDSVTAKAEKFWNAIGGITGAAIALAAITFAGPLLGLASLALSLTTLTSSVIPAAVLALGGLGIAAGAFHYFGDPNDKIGTWIDEHVPGASWVDNQASRVGLGRNYNQQDVAAGRVPHSAADMISYLMGKGWTKEQAAGIVGNLMQESSLSPGASNGSHYGLAQWDKSRQADFKAKYGRDIQGSTVEQQLDWIDYELREGKERATGDALARQKDAATSARVFNQGYERPGSFDTSGPQREANAVAASQIQINVTAPPGTRVEAKDKDGTSLRARVTHSMAADGSMP